MSHHFVTVCVVCVLCAAHTPCSAHTDFKIADASSYDIANQENIPNSKNQLLTSELRSKQLMQLKDHLKIKANTLDQVKHDIKKYIDTQEINKNKQVITKVVPVAVDKSYSEKRVLEKKKIIKDNQEPHKNDTNVLLKNDLEVLERLGQIELMIHEKQGFTYFSNDHTKDSRLRKRRSIDVNEKYFMKKIFEAYGDGKSMTMEGFEKLLRKLGLLTLLTDISKLEGHNMGINRSENQLGKYYTKIHVTVTTYKK